MTFSPFRTCSFKFRAMLQPSLGDIWQMSGDAFGCQNQEESTTEIYWVEPRGAAKHPTICSIPFPHKELSRSKCQLCQGSETLVQTNRTHNYVILKLIIKKMKAQLIIKIYSAVSGAAHKHSFLFLQLFSLCFQLIQERKQHFV